jgi:Conjugative transposon protein TcpC
MATPAVDGRPARVRVTTHTLARIRLQRELPRYLFFALAAAGILASVRFAVAPPRTAAPAPAHTLPDARDLGAEGFALLFARRYLTWSGSEPLASARSLESFTGSALEPDAGLRLPASGEQRVEWLEVVQERAPAPAAHVYTVAAQTDSAGLVYLAVTVRRETDGALSLAGYPAFVGAPAYVAAHPPQRLREVSNLGLQTVVERALRNYLAGSEANLAADLAPGAHVSLPRLGLALQSLTRLDWAPGGGAVLALAQAQDTRGVHYSLEYELDVTQAAGRWEIGAIEMDPAT